MFELILVLAGVLLGTLIGTPIGIHATKEAALEIIEEETTKMEIKKKGDV